MGKVGKLIDIYKTFTTCIYMKLKDLLSKVVENKKNGQLNTSIKKNSLKKTGMSEDDLFNMKVDTKLNRLLLE